MPYTASLADEYGYATDYTAITHPSLPNYIAIAGGTTYGITDDDGPSSHPLDGSSVFGQAVSAGETAKVYEEGMISNCMLSDTGLYAVKHNPWAYFTPSSERTPCSSYDVPESLLATDAAAGTLPTVGMVVPDLCNDGHDCSLSVADTWFETQMQLIFAGPDWKSGHLAVVLTADEDDGSQGNKVFTVVIHPSQSGNVVTAPLTHYSLTRLYEDVAGVSHLNNAATAPSMSSAFGLPMP
jgi:phospholipase C